MKKTSFLLFALFYFSICCKAQLDKGTWLVGGNGNIDFYKQDFKADYTNYTANITKIDIDCSIGYFIIDKLVLGVRPTFFLENGKFYENGNFSGKIGTRTNLLIGPGVRYYILNKDKSFNVFTDLSYQFGTNKDPISPNKSKGVLRQFSASTGLEIFLNSVVGIEILAGYKNKYETINYGNGSFYSDKKNSLQINIGFQIHLQKN